MLKQLVLWIAVCAFFTVSFSSCGGKSKQTESRTRKYTIGICVAQESEATQSMHRAINEGAPAEDAYILWASAEQNEATQEHILKEFFANGAKGIILEPVNHYAAGLLIDDAQNRGIPVVGIGVLPEAKQLGAFVMPDLQGAAEKMVHGIIERRRRLGGVLILMTEISDSMEMAFVRSMLNILKENGSEYHVYGLSTDSGAIRRALNTILFSPSPTSAVIATRLLYTVIASDLYRLGLISPRPILACYSGDERARDALQSGTIDIVVDPQPAVIGTAALSSIIRLMKELPPTAQSRKIQSGDLSIPVIKTPVQVIYSKNLSRN